MFRKFSELKLKPLVDFQLYQQRTYSFEPKNRIEWPKKIISGVQPTGVLHVGNYFGAVQRWVRLQNDGEHVSFFLADLHSMTLPYDPNVLRENIYQMTATLLACGIDPKKSNLFLQSTIPQHAELNWILGCLTTMPRLSNLPQFKEKSTTLKNTLAGLFFYPVLQSADILIHRATHVPCGDDQEQQLQLTMHLAKIFNNKFGETFPIITPMIEKDASSRIRSLRDPTKKQSKSDPNAKSRLTLRDTPDEWKLKIKRAITDFTSEVTYDPDNRPGVANLITIHALTTNLTPNDIVKRARGLDTAQYKLLVVEDFINHFNPIRQKIEDFLKNRDYLEQILRDGQLIASEEAERTMKEVKSRIGINIC